MMKAQGLEPHSNLICATHFPSFSSGHTHNKMTIAIIAMQFECQCWIQFSFFCLFYHSIQRPGSLNLWFEFNVFGPRMGSCMKTGGKKKSSLNSIPNRGYWWFSMDRSSTLSSFAAIFYFCSFCSIEQ